MPNAEKETSENMLNQAEPTINKSEEKENMQMPDAPSNKQPGFLIVLQGVAYVVFTPIRLAALAAARILLGKERYDRLMEKYDKKDQGQSEMNALKQARKEFGKALEQNIKEKVYPQNPDLKIIINESKTKGFYGCYDVRVSNPNTKEKFSLFINQNGKVVGQLNRNKQMDIEANARLVMKAIDEAFALTPQKSQEKEKEMSPETKSTVFKNPLEALLARLQIEVKSTFGPDAKISIQHNSTKEGHKGESEITATYGDNQTVTLFIGHDGDISNTLAERGLSDEVKVEGETAMTSIVDTKLNAKIKELSDLYMRCVSEVAPQQMSERAQTNIVNMLRNDLGEKYKADFEVHQSLSPSAIGAVVVVMASKENTDNRIFATVQNGKVTDAKMFFVDKDEAAKECAGQSLMDIKHDIEVVAKEHAKNMELERSLQRHYQKLTPKDKCEIEIKRSENPNHKNELEISIRRKDESFVAYMDKQGNLTNGEQELYNDKNEFSQKMFDNINDVAKIARYEIYRTERSVETIGKPYLDENDVQKQVKSAMVEARESEQQKAIFSMQGVEFIITEPEKGVFNIEAHLHSEVTSGETRSFGSAVQFNSPDGTQVPADVITNINNTVVAAIINEARDVDNRYGVLQEKDPEDIAIKEELAGITPSGKYIVEEFDLYGMHEEEKEVTASILKTNHEEDPVITGYIDIDQDDGLDL